MEEKLTKKQKEFLKNRVHIFQRFVGPGLRDRIVEHAKFELEESEGELKYYIKLLKTDLDKEIKEYFGWYAKIHEFDVKINQEMLKDLENVKQ